MVVTGRTVVTVMDTVVTVTTDTMVVVTAITVDITADTMVGTMVVTDTDTVMDIMDSNPIFIIIGSLPTI